MKLRALGLAVGLSIAQAGCYASKMLDALPEGDRVELPAQPVTTLPVVIPRPRARGARSSEQDEYERAYGSGSRLLSLLRASSLVPAAGWADEYPGRKVVLIRPEPAPPVEGTIPDGDNILWFVTDALDPSRASLNLGVFFRRLDADAPEFRCDWRITRVRSVFLALPLLPFAEWQFKTEWDIPIENVRRCLIEQSAVFAVP